MVDSIYPSGQLAQINMGIIHQVGAMQSSSSDNSGDCLGLMEKTSFCWVTSLFQVKDPDADGMTVYQTWTAANRRAEVRSPSSFPGQNSLWYIIYNYYFIISLCFWFEHHSTLAVWEISWDVAADREARQGGFRFHLLSSSRWGAISWHVLRKRYAALDSGWDECRTGTAVYGSWLLSLFDKRVSTERCMVSGLTGHWCWFLCQIIQSTILLLILMTGWKNMAILPFTVTWQVSFFFLLLFFGFISCCSSLKMPSQHRNLSKWWWITAK